MNLRATLEKLYPTKSYGGQCFSFLHRLVDFPSVGTLASTKVNSLNRFGIPIKNLDSIKVGDVILFDEPPVMGFKYDHGGLVNAIVNGKLQITESNFYYISKPGRVTHDRLVSPNDKSILGVFRSKALYPIPTVNYPIQLTVKILMNNQPLWPSLLQHMANLQNWFWEASGQRIELIINYKQTNVTGWETAFTGPGTGNVEIIKEEWYDQHILPLGEGADIVIFNMPRSDWHGTVFDHPELIELGHCYEKVDMNFPIKIFTVADEHDDFPPYYPKLGAYAKLMAHECSHGLYGLCLNPNKVTGDYTHLHFFGRNPDFPIRPEDILNDLDFELLSSKIQ